MKFRFNIIQLSVQIYISPVWCSCAYCVRNACMSARCTARHTFCFVSFYCYEYWALLDMLYVCWNTLIFETASLQFSHECFKIGIKHSYARRWIRRYVKCMHAYLVPDRFPSNNGSGKLPWQSNAKQWKCFWISQYLFVLVRRCVCMLCYLYPLPCYPVFVYSLASRVIIWIFPLSLCTLIHSLIITL